MAKKQRNQLAESIPIDISSELPGLLMTMAGRSHEAARECTELREGAPAIVKEINGELETLP